MKAKFVTTIVTTVWNLSCWLNPSKILCWFDILLTHRTIISSEICHRAPDIYVTLPSNYLLCVLVHNLNQTLSQFPDPHNDFVETQVV